MDRVEPHGSVIAPFAQAGGRQLEIRAGRAWLQGELTVPANPGGLVLFAHGSGSSRFSARNLLIASALNQAGLATCLFDLLSLEEEQDAQAQESHRFDVALLGQRLVEVTDWIYHHFQFAGPLGYFGTGTGAAAAFIAAVKRRPLVKAVVSRSGRADMAVSALHQMSAPTLLLAGSCDPVVVELNRLVYRQLPNHLQKELVIIDGAGHWFEEPGALSQAAQYATQWFTQCFTNERPDDAD